LVICLLAAGLSALEVYSTGNRDEVEVLALVLQSEVQANAWNKDEIVCFSVEGKDPDKKLVQALRRHNLNVRSQAEWRRKLVCGFQVTLRFVRLDFPLSAQIRADVADFREINTGQAHVAVRLRSGEYMLLRCNGKWSVGSYTPSN